MKVLNTCITNRSKAKQSINFEHSLSSMKIGEKALIMGYSKENIFSILARYGLMPGDTVSIHAKAFGVTALKKENTIIAFRNKLLKLIEITKLQ